MKTEHRQAYKVLGVHSTFPLSVGNTEQRASKQITNIIAAQMEKGVPKATHEPRLSHTVLPTRSKCKVKTKPVKEVHRKMHTPVASTMWTYNACRREMLDSQKDSQLAGKAHNARVKQVSSAVSNGFPLPSTDETTLLKQRRHSELKKKGES